MLPILSAPCCGSKRTACLHWERPLICVLFLSEAYLFEISVPFRFFGQVQTIVILSGPGYDFRQGALRGSSPGSADRMTATYTHPVGSPTCQPHMAMYGRTRHGTPVRPLPQRVADRMNNTF